MDMNADGIENGQPEEYYHKLGGSSRNDLLATFRSGMFSERLLRTTAGGGGARYEYPRQGREDRERVYFLGMMLRIIRAIDVLTEQPEWDCRTVAVFGISQDGFQAIAVAVFGISQGRFQAIAAAGLDPQVTFFAAGESATANCK